MSHGSSTDRFQQLEEAYKEYTVYDQHYEKIGKVDDLFVDESDQPEYIGVKTGFLGMKSTLVPMAMARVNDRRKLVEIAADKDAIENAPTFDTNKEITPDYEHEVHTYFGLERPHSSTESSGYGDYYHSDSHDDERLEQQVDTEYGERAETSSYPSAGTSSGTEHRDDSHTSSSRPAESLDIPLDRQESREPERREPVVERQDSEQPRREVFGDPNREPVRDEPVRDEPVRKTPGDLNREPVRNEPVGDSLAGSGESSRSDEDERVFTGGGQTGGMKVHKRIRRTV